MQDTVRRGPRGRTCRLLRDGTMLLFRYSKPSRPRLWVLLWLCMQGVAPRKNIDVMKEAIKEAGVPPAGDSEGKKKKKKKKEEVESDEEEEQKPKKKKKKSSEEEDEAPKKKKKASKEEDAPEKKKKKKKDKE